MKFFSLLHTFLAKVPEISPELVHKHRWWLSSDQRSRGTLFSNVGNILVALQILINVPMVSYKTLHHSLFPPLCKFCIRKWMWNKNAWKHIKMKKTGLKNLKKTLKSTSFYVHCEDFEMTNWIIKLEPHAFSQATYLDLHDTGSALPLVSEGTWILSWKTLVVLRNTDMQGD